MTEEIMKPNTYKNLLEWSVGGDTGNSSKAMVRIAIGINTSDNPSYPLDPADFNRCLKLVRAVPEIRNSFGDIAKTSKEWARIIKNWDLVEKTFIDEVGFDWSLGKKAKKTYYLMDCLEYDNGDV